MARGKYESLSVGPLLSLAWEPLRGVSKEVCCNRAHLAPRPMIDVDTLLHCRWVVPVVPRGLVLENHAVAIEAGRIVEVLPAEAAFGRYRGREVEDLR